MTTAYAAGLLPGLLAPGFVDAVLPPPPASTTEALLEPLALARQGFL